MTKAKRVFTLFTTFALLVVTICSMCVPASAATCSNGTNTQTIYVNTKAAYYYPGSASITLKQTKGVCTKSSYSFWTGKTTTKTSNQYGTWSIVATATDGTDTVKKTLSGSSVTIKLKANKTYKITVTWNTASNTITELNKGTFTTLPSWKVSGTWKVTSYY